MGIPIHFWFLSPWWLNIEFSHPKICHLCFSFWKVFSWMICPFIYCVISSLAKFNDYFLKNFFSLELKKVSGPASCKSYQLQRGGSWREEREITIWAKPAWRPAIWQTSRHMAGREHGNENNLSTGESVLRIWPVTERKRQKGKSTSFRQLYSNCTSEFWENISLTFWRRFLSLLWAVSLFRCFFCSEEGFLKRITSLEWHGPILAWFPGIWSPQKVLACIIYTSGFPLSSFDAFRLTLRSLISFEMYFCAGWQMWK